jgi:hypothetical protein
MTDTTNDRIAALEREIQALRPADLNNRLSLKALLERDWAIQSARSRAQQERIQRLAAAGSPSVL